VDNDVDFSFFTKWFVQQIKSIFTN
jgi:hypothetical protein